LSWIERNIGTITKRPYKRYVDDPRRTLVNIRNYLNLRFFCNNMHSFYSYLSSL